MKTNRNRSRDKDRTDEGFWDAAADAVGATDIANAIRGYHKSKVKNPPAAPVEPSVTTPTPTTDPIAPSSAPSTPPAPTPAAAAQPQDIFKNPQELASAWEEFKKSSPTPSEAEALRSVIKNMLGRMGATKITSNAVESAKYQLIQNRIITNEDLNKISPKKRQLYEGMSYGDIKSIMLWESVGRQLVEFKLTANQIEQLFQQSEAAMTAGGAGIASNRTMIGKGKDAVDLVSKMVSELGTAAQNLKPVKQFDNLCDNLTRKLLNNVDEKTGKQQVKPFIAKYRQLAKDHPILQGFIYAALIMGTGLATGGAAGPVVVGALKAVDRVLQGDKMSSALAKGASAGIKTVLVQGVKNITSDIMSGGGQAANLGGGSGGSAEPWREFHDAHAPVDNGSGAGSDAELDVPQFTQYEVQKGDVLSKIAQDNNVSVAELQQANPDIANVHKLEVGQQLNIPSATGSSVFDKGAGLGGPTANPSGAVDATAGTETAPEAEVEAPTAQPTAQPTPTNTGPTWANNTGVGSKESLAGQGTVPADIQLRNDPNQALRAKVQGESVDRFTRNALTEAQISAIFYRIELKERAAMLVRESAWDDIKQGVKKKVAQVGKNITTKVTADKLTKAWNKAKQPTDSDQLIDFLVDQGVNRAVAEKTISQFNTTPAAPSAAATPGGAPAAGTLAGNTNPTSSVPASGNLFSNPNALEHAWQDYTSGGGKYGPALNNLMKSIWTDTWWLTSGAKTMDGSQPKQQNISWDQQNGPQRAGLNTAPTAPPAAPATSTPTAAPTAATTTPTAATTTPTAATVAPAAHKARKLPKRNAAPMKDGKRVKTNSSIEQVLFADDIILSESDMFDAIMQSNKLQKLAHIAETRQMAANHLSKKRKS